MSSPVLSPLDSRCAVGIAGSIARRASTGFREDVAGADSVTCMKCGEVFVRPACMETFLRLVAL